MSHPFGDLISQYLHRKHGLNQSRLATGINQPHFVITLMCQGKRLTGSQARERVLAIIEWLQQQHALYEVKEANRLLETAGMSGLDTQKPRESAIVAKFDAGSQHMHASDHTSSTPQSKLEGNIPQITTSFIGRGQEIDTLRRLMIGEGYRLVTLAGAGGTGKTRLAIEVARSLQGSFRDGVWLVELAGLTDPQLVPVVIATTLGLHELNTHTPLNALIDLLQSRQLLLLVDNCEHLVEACAYVLKQILHYCPSVWMVATSREILGVDGEYVYHVLPLEVPPVSAPEHDQETTSLQLMQYDAIRLFVDRARIAQPRFMLSAQDAETVIRICRQLDGIPLAIELAAARLNMLSVEQIATRLGDRFRLLTGGHRTNLPRQQTLRALIDWSYDLLPERERLLLQRLAIFAGGWSLEAAESVCAGGLLVEDEILDLLTQLANKSLVIMEEHDNEAYYHMLETLRAYAHEKLAETGDEKAVAEKHLHYYLMFVEMDEPVRQAHEQRAWFGKLGREQDNLRTALNWAQVHDPDRAARLSRSIWWFWYLRDTNA